MIFKITLWRDGDEDEYTESSVCLCQESDEMWVPERLNFPGCAAHEVNSAFCL